MTGVLTRERNLDTGLQREKGPVKTEAETGVMSLQEAQEGQGLLATTRSWERGKEQSLPQSLQKEPTLQTP